MKKEALDTGLQYVLDELVARVKPILGDNLLAVYLQGSFALGGGDKDSDVDFLVVVEDDIPDTLLPELQAMHSSLFEIDSYWSHHLEGSYFPKDLLRQEDPNRTPIVYIDNGSRNLERSNHDNELVVLWVTREHGITLYGADPKTYIDPIDTDDLIREVKQTMHTWRQEIIDGDYTIGNVWAQAFAVIMYCRMLHTVTTGAIHSKPEGVQWALRMLDKKWHDLIAEAWEKRANQYTRVANPSDPDAVSQTIDFISYALTYMTSI